MDNSPIAQLRNALLAKTDYADDLFLQVVTLQRQIHELEAEIARLHHGNVRLVSQLLGSPMHPLLSDPAFAPLPFDIDLNPRFIEAPIQFDTRCTES